MLQPVLVRAGGDGFELIAGERRWRAARRIGLQTIPAIVRTADDAAMLQQAIVENVQREELNPLEEAAAYQQLIEDFRLTHDDVAARVGKSRTTITNTLRLLQLPPSIQRQPQGAARSAWAMPAPCWARPTARSRSSSPSARSPKSCRYARSRKRSGPRGAAAKSRPRKPRRIPVTELRPPGLLELEELLGDYLETRVKITMSPRRGRVEIEFATLEDLERIYRLITEPAPDRRARRRRRWSAQGSTSIGSSIPRRMPERQRGAQAPARAT